MTLREQVLARLVDRLRAENQDVYQHRFYALEQGTRNVFVVRVAAAEELDEEMNSNEAEARLLPVSVLAIAHTAEKLFELAEIADKVLFAMHRDGELRDIPRPTFDTADRESEDAMLEATWTAQLPFRMSVFDPSVEV